MREIRSYVILCIICHFYSELFPVEISDSIDHLITKEINSGKHLASR